MKHSITSYGQIIAANHKRTNVSIVGKGKNIIVFLARKTSPIPVLEMKPLAHFLKGKYTIVTIDYLGSGFSENYNSNRTLENITSEIYDVIKELGYTSYFMVALSYAGLYSLYYANKYPNEVKAVMGIDTYVAEQVDNPKLAGKIRFYDDMWEEYHGLKIVQLFIRHLAAKYLKRSKEYRYSKQDIYTYSSFALNMMNNVLLLKEYKCSDENFRELKNVCFPANIPVLFILSGYRTRKIRGWYDLHKKLLQNNNSKIITLKSNKNLHLTCTENVAKEIDEFISSLK